MPPVAVTTAPMLDVPPVLPSDDVPAGIDAPPAPTVMLWPEIAATGTTFQATPPSPPPPPTGGAALEPPPEPPPALTMQRHHVTAADEGV